MIITPAEFRAVESMSDFVDLLNQKFLRIMDIRQTGLVEILFVEKMDVEWGFVIHSKDKSSLDLEGKDIFSSFLFFFFISFI